SLQRWVCQIGLHAERIKHADRSVLPGARAASTLGIRSENSCQSLSIFWRHIFLRLRRASSSTSIIGILPRDHAIAVPVSRPPNKTMPMPKYDRIFLSSKDRPPSSRACLTGRRLTDRASVFPQPGLPDHGNCAGAFEPMLVLDD